MQDLKVSKNDILDILIEQLRENLEEKLKQTQRDFDESVLELREFKKEQEDKHYSEQLKKLEEDPKIQALKKAIEDFTGEPSEIKTLFRYYYLTVKQNFLKDECSPFSFAKDHNDGFRIAKMLSFKETDEIKEKTKKTKEKEQLYLTAKNKLSEFNNTANRMRTKILKQFLAGTEEGNKLLDLIDKSRTGKQLVKAINTTSE